MFVAGMYAAAFFEDDPRRVVEAGLASIPAQSGYARLIRDVLKWSSEYPEDWKRTWGLLKEKWDKADPCPKGALRPYNIDARLNGGHVAIGLLYGGGDFSKTIEIATRSGQDSDCNPSSAAGILGVMIGYSNIPAEWKSGISDISNKKFSFTNYSFNEIVDSTVARALKVIVSAGGRVAGDEAFVPVRPHAHEEPPLEQWDPGLPDRNVPPSDSGWKWGEGWTEKADKEGVVRKVSDRDGSSATLHFEGQSVAILGPYSMNGGKADVFIDGKRVGEINAYGQTRDHVNDLWAHLDLKRGNHVLQVLTRKDKDPRSGGTQVIIERCLTYRPRS
jgi:hypothetical protein